MERELRDGIKAAHQATSDAGAVGSQSDIPLPQALIQFEIENLARQLHFPTGGDDEKTRELKVQLLGIRGTPAGRFGLAGFPASDRAGDQGR
jgi:hypothetical protein